MAERLTKVGKPPAARARVPRYSAARQLSNQLIKELEEARDVVSSGSQGPTGPAGPQGPPGDEVQHNLVAVAAPTEDDDSDDGYEVRSLWLDTSTGNWYIATSVSVGNAFWEEITNNSLGALASLDVALANRIDLGLVTSVDLTSGNGTVSGEVASQVVRGFGNGGTNRNLQVTPAAGASFSSRTLWLWNDSGGSGTIQLQDHSSSSVGNPVAANTMQLFRWAANAWAQTPLILPVGLSSGAGLTALTDKVAADVGDLTTLSEATHSFRLLNSTDLEWRPLRLRNASNQANPVDVMLPDGFGKYVEFGQAADQTGTCRVNVSRTLGYDNLTGTFTVGETITDGTSGATARVFADTGSVLTLVNVSGTFGDNNTITGGTSGATASVDGTIQGSATINGVTTIGLTGARASTWLKRENTNVFVLKGDITGPVTVEQLNVLGTIYTTERAAAPADTAGLGQVWVKSDTPNNLYFTDDAGNDFNLSRGFLPIAGGTLTGNLLATSQEIYGQFSPWQTATGSMSGAASARSWNVTGNLTAIPVTNGWWGKFKNESGSGKTMALASGTFVNLIDGTTGTTLTLADDRGCVLHANGTNMMVEGTVTLS